LKELGNVDGGGGGGGGGAWMIHVFVVVVSTMNFCVPQDNRASGWVCIVGFSGEKHEQALEFFCFH
jgi:hypothetical protein